jgi:hypothetical protein
VLRVQSAKRQHSPCPFLPWQAHAKPREVRATFSKHILKQSLSSVKRSIQSKTPAASSNAVTGTVCLFKIALEGAETFQRYCVRRWSREQTNYWHVLIITASTLRVDCGDVPAYSYVDAPETQLSVHEVNQCIPFFDTVVSVIERQVTYC